LGGDVTRRNNLLIAHLSLGMTRKVHSDAIVQKIHPRFDRESDEKYSNANLGTKFAEYV
jgi:hypothetical protein